VDQAIHELVLSGRVCVVAQKPLVVDPLSVSIQPCGKKRLILDSNLKDIRIAALCSLAFAGFFRYIELCNIAPNHIEFHSQYIKIFVPRSKTDVYREGNYVYISAWGSQYCPVGVLRKYMNLAGIHDNNDYGLHSLRSGGITSVVSDSCNSVSERLLKVHGRWKTDAAKDMYVEESLDNRLQVTKFLRALIQVAVVFVSVLFIAS